LATFQNSVLRVQVANAVKVAVAMNRIIIATIKVARIVKVPGSNLAFANNPRAVNNSPIKVARLARMSLGLSPRLRPSSCVVLESRRKLIAD